MSYIPFNRPFVIGKEFGYLKQAINNIHLSGNGPFTIQCQSWLESILACKKALLTHSCTGALEMAAILADIRPGDEIIMPSFTFVSTANAFVVRGGVPVFVDICPDTLNIDESKVEDAVTGATKAIVPVHYAGVGCNMDAITDVAKKKHLLVIEDAAQGLMASYRGRSLGSIGDIAALSFHESKNVMCGEGGALLLNDTRWIERSEIIWEKGTNRSQFFRGMVDKYNWIDIGSSYLPSEINAAFLWAQLEEAESITRKRLKIWNLYHEGFSDLEKEGKIRRPIIPAECKHNAHIYYLLLPDLGIRTTLIEKMREDGIITAFHYIPLHSSPAGLKYGRNHGDLSQTQNLSERLMRLPLWIGMTDDDVNRVVTSVSSTLL